MSWTPGGQLLVWLTDTLQRFGQSQLVDCGYRSELVMK